MIDKKWKAIPGFPGYYASENGKIGSAKKREYGTWIITDTIQRVLRPGKHPGGYLSVGMTIDGIPYQRRIHTLVALTFLGERPEGQEVCHTNNNKLDNSVENLRYDTPLGNAADSRCLTDDQAIAIRDAKTGTEVHRLIIEFGIDSTTAHGIKAGRLYRDIGPSDVISTKGSLSADNVNEIKDLRNSGYKLAEIGRKFGISESMVSLICSGKRYAYIEE